jgi:hypothetical protein
VTDTVIAPSSVHTMHPPLLQSRGLPHDSPNVALD